MRRLSPASLLIAALLALGLPACGSASSTSGADQAARAKGGVGLKKIGSFDHPVYVAGAPGYPKLLFVVEQAGRVVVLKGGRRLPRPFLDLRSAVGYDGGERGLLSIAFPPDYRQSGSFYVYYNDRAGNIRIDEFKRGSATRAAPRSQREVIGIPHPVNANHNGGQMQFLDDLLYFGTGDGGSGGDPPNNAQNKDVLLGKLLRIDPRASGGVPYTVPPSNPFVGKPGRDEIYSYGLRNPFRFSFDTVSAGQPRIAIGDVGQNKFEELDYATVAAASGANFGWDALEGFSPYTEENSGTSDPGGTTKPIFAYSHSRDGSCSIIGGYVVRDRALPSLYKRYVYADLCEGQLRSLVPHLKHASGDRKLGLAVESPSSFGEDDAHHLYVTSISGPVFRLVPR
ncbi:MAG TPA: PQQ-dependent sugar dehydrogenase [Solirubrobacterales bacterium]|jgi:glucose/arabinose dehydrogenase|nr:PQQ-dependent sugar dehydrogenase [Solirubrobacterales bacterium]